MKLWEDIGLADEELIEGQEIDLEAKTETREVKAFLFY